MYRPTGGPQVDILGVQLSTADLLRTTHGLHSGAESAEEQNDRWTQVVQSIGCEERGVFIL